MLDTKSRHCGEVGWRGALIPLAVTYTPYINRVKIVHTHIRLFCEKGTFYST